MMDDKDYCNDSPCVYFLFAENKLNTAKVRIKWQKQS
jgi:hypothetical protein